MIDKAGHKGEGHRERLREKFLKSGLTGFHDYEVVELLLTLSTPRRDCKDAAKAAMARFKTLSGVLSADADELSLVEGIGPKNALGILLVQAVSKRFLESGLAGKDPLRSTRETFDYLYHHLRDRKTECFTAIFLDSQNRVISVETLFEGTVNASHVYPREVVRKALSHHAAGVIIAHNHPSGEPRPSADDRAVTREVLFACRVMGIRVLDHLVIGANRYFSFSEDGEISRLDAEFDKAAVPRGI